MITPTLEQKVFLESPHAYEEWDKKPRGAGATTALLLGVFARIADPQYRGVIVFPRHDYAREAFRRWDQYTALECKASLAMLRVTAINGGTVTFVSVNSTRDLEKFTGMTYDHIAIDMIESWEYGEMTGLSDIVARLEQKLRRSPPGIMRVARTFL